MTICGLWNDDTFQKSKKIKTGKKLFCAFSFLLKNPRKAPPPNPRKPGNVLAIFRAFFLKKPWKSFFTSLRAGFQGGGEEGPEY